MKKKMQCLMVEIKRRMSVLRNDSEPDDLRMRICMGKTILLMKNLRESIADSGKYCELVRSDTSKSMQKCRQEMGFLYGIVPCNDGGGKVNHAVRRVFYQRMDAVLVELGYFIRDTPKKQNSIDAKLMGLQHISHKMMLLGDRAETERALRDLRSQISKSQLLAKQSAFQTAIADSNNDGGDAVRQISPKWSDLITKLSGKTKKTHQIPLRIPDCNCKRRQLSESCRTLDLRVSDNETKTSFTSDGWQNMQDSGNITQTRSTSFDSLFRSEGTLKTFHTHQTRDRKVNCRQRCESCLNLTENRKKTSHMDHSKEYQEFLAKVYKPVHGSSTSLEMTPRTPVSVTKQTSLSKTSIKPKGPPSTTSHFSLGKTFGDKRVRLLRWCKSRTRSYGLPMYEFSESWTSGRALVAILHSYHKNLIEPRFLTKESPQDTLTYGAEFAKSLGVHCGVDIVQVCLKKKPDFLKVFQFVKELHSCLDRRLK